MDLYVVALLHFNLQYVAGGMEGTFADWPCDEQSIEDQIIIESFEPILDLMLEHPDWSIDLELQGYMVEVMADRHPPVLDKLHTLAHGGQVELVSWHYSAQPPAPTIQRPAPSGLERQRWPPTPELGRSFVTGD